MPVHRDGGPDMLDNSVLDLGTAERGRAAEEALEGRTSRRPGSAWPVSRAGIERCSRSESDSRAPFESGEGGESTLLYSPSYNSPYKSPCK
jgi:hypothetical protein